MEPNIFVAYIKVMYFNGNYYTSKAFLTKREARDYLWEMVGAAERHTSVAGPTQVMGKLLTLAMPAKIERDLNWIEPSMEEQKQLLLKGLDEFVHLLGGGSTGRPGMPAIADTEK